ncbi:MAG TPA: R3H domain-containing nucleic acid-binding protein [Patescibacteria group bacterium]|nr:R3H domain-containing nucleic acid-binding protein [Patescibacteria group bacterium]
MTEEQKTTIVETTQSLLQLLGITAEVAIEVSGDIPQITISAEETGMLIGYHGETLEGLQLLLSLMVARKLGEFIRLSVEVGDYKKNREIYLNDMVNQAKERVLAEHISVSLPSLKSWERRVVHLLLSDDPDVISESEGEGRERTLIIHPK